MHKKRYGIRIDLGDINDPNSEIARLLATPPTQVIKPGMGMYPQAFYIDMDLDIVGAK